MKNHRIIDMAILNNIKKFISSHTKLPDKIERPGEEQLLMIEKAKNLSIYEFYTCPFCMRVRHTVKKLGIPIEYRNTQQNPEHRNELIREGGSLQVPCLRIEDKSGTRWIYESRDIINYLEENFA